MSKRTTVTLDDDTAGLVAEEMKRYGSTFGEAVNELIRSGASERKKASKGRRIRVRARDMGLRDGLEIDSISSLLEDLEGPLHR